MPDSRNISLVVFAISIALAALLVRIAVRHTVPPLRTVDLAMRDYTFNGTNPTLRFRKGDRVRFVVRNEETTPIRHNFAIPELHVPCDQELGPGEIRHVIVTLTKRGTFEYLCCTHRGMKGMLVVQ